MRRILKSGCLMRFGFCPGAADTSRRIFGSVFGSTCNIVKPQTTFVLAASCSARAAATSGSGGFFGRFLKQVLEGTLLRRRHNQRRTCRRLNVRRHSWRTLAPAPDQATSRRARGEDEAESERADHRSLRRRTTRYPPAVPSSRQAPTRSLGSMIRDPCEIPRNSVMRIRKRNSHPKNGAGDIFSRHCRSHACWAVPLSQHTA